METNTESYPQEKPVMDFYDPLDQVIGNKAVTIRMVREENDKYDKFEAGKRFTIHQPDQEFEGEGLILAHWKLPLRSIPAELVAGEGYDLSEQSFESYEDVKNFLLETTLADLKQYYDVSLDTLLHVIVYVPATFIDEGKNFIQTEDTTKPYQWLLEHGDAVLGHLASYATLKKFS
jgi:hypothetical protein